MSTYYVVGESVRILPAYDMDTRARTRHDEFTGLVGTIVRFCTQQGTDDVLVDIKDREVWINRGRVVAAVAYL